MNKKTRTVLLISAFALFLALGSFAYNTLGQDANVPEVSQGQREKAPDFTITSSNGNPVKLSSMRGKPVVLNFWASWCPPCKEEMPGFDKVFKEMGTDITFMMVDLVDGQRETEAAGASYVKKQGFSFPVYFDIDQEAAYAYNINSIPTTLFIDEEGFVVKLIQGSMDEKKLRQGIGLLN